MTAAEKLINDCVSPFTETQRQRLKDLSDVRSDRNYTQENRRLEDYLETLKDMYPEKFHRTKADLDSRVFFDEPTTIATPRARCVRSRDQSPYQRGNK